MVGAEKTLFGHLPIFEPVLNEDVIYPGYHRVDDKVFILVKGIGGLYPQGGWTPIFGENSNLRGEGYFVSPNIETDPDKGIMAVCSVMA